MGISLSPPVFVKPDNGSTSGLPWAHALCDRFKRIIPLTLLRLCVCVYVHHPLRVVMSSVDTYSGAYGVYWWSYPIDNDNDAAEDLLLAAIVISDSKSPAAQPMSRLRLKAFPVRVQDFRCPPDQHEAP